MSTDEQEKWIAMGMPEPIAAERYDGEQPCEYEDCDNPAHFRVEWRRQTDGAIDHSLMCDRCSRTNAVHVEGNDLLDYELRSEPEGA